jgi:hypothetical protein
MGKKNHNERTSTSGYLQKLKEPAVFITELAKDHQFQGSSFTIIVFLGVVVIY